MESTDVEVIDVAYDDVDVVNEDTCVEGVAVFDDDDDVDDDVIFDWVDGVVICVVVDDDDGDDDDDNDDDEAGADDVVKVNGVGDDENEVV